MSPWEVLWSPGCLSPRAGTPQGAHHPVPTTVPAVRQHLSSVASKEVAVGGWPLGKEDVQGPGHWAARAGLCLLFHSTNAYVPPPGCVTLGKSFLCEPEFFCTVVLMKTSDPPPRACLTHRSCLMGGSYDRGHPQLCLMTHGAYGDAPRGGGSSLGLIHERLLKPDYSQR